MAAARSAAWSAVPTAPRPRTRPADRPLGARLHYRPDGADIEAAMQQVARDGKRAGGVPYVIPAGGSSRAD